LGGCLSSYKSETPGRDVSLFIRESTAKRPDRKRERTAVAVFLLFWVNPVESGGFPDAEN